jgi:hypothetical protein
MAKPPAEDLAHLPRPASSRTTWSPCCWSWPRAHEAVLARLARMQLADQPDKLASRLQEDPVRLEALQQVLRLPGGRRVRPHAGRLAATRWSESSAPRTLRPRWPCFQAFIESDAAWFERADDSDGVIGDAVRSACQHWLRAAARCETPARRVARSALARDLYSGRPVRRPR